MSSRRAQILQQGSSRVGQNEHRTTLSSASHRFRATAACNQAGATQMHEDEIACV